MTITINAGAGFADVRFVRLDLAAGHAAFGVEQQSGSDGEHLNVIFIDPAQELSLGGLIDTAFLCPPGDIDYALSTGPIEAIGVARIAENELLLIQGDDRVRLERNSAIALRSLIGSAS